MSTRRRNPCKLTGKLLLSADWQADAVLFFTFEDSPEPLPGFKRWLEQSGGWLSRSLALSDFRSKYQDVAVYYGPAEAKISRVVQVGLGPAEKFDMDKLRGATVVGLRKCRELKLTSVVIPLSAFDGLPGETASALEEVLIAGALGLYRFDALKTRDVEAGCLPGKTCDCLAEEEPDEALRQVCFFADAVVYGNSLDPGPGYRSCQPGDSGVHHQSARDLAEEYGLRLQVIDMRMAEEMGMRAFLAVAQGSREPAYVIVLEHAPAGTEQDAPLVFVGKGITFDTGGISLKPSAKMEMMKRRHGRSCGCSRRPLSFWAEQTFSDGWSAFSPVRKTCRAARLTSRAMSFTPLPT